MQRKKYTHRNPELEGNCECGLPYKGHPRCDQCEVLAHKDLKYCKTKGSDVVVGYILVGSNCYSCRKGIREKRKRADPVYARRLLRGRAKSKEYRRTHPEKVKEYNQRGKATVVLYSKMRYTNDPIARAKRSAATRAWRAKNPGYAAQYARQWREKKRLNEKNTTQTKPKASKTNET